MKTVSKWTELALNSLQALGETLMGAIPNILGALILLLLGWLLAKGAAKLTQRLLKKTNIDRWTEKLSGSEAFQKNKIKIDTAKVISGFVYWLIILVFFITASDTLGWKSVSKEIGTLVRYLPQLLSAIVIFVIGMYIANFVRQALLATFTSLGVTGSKLLSDLAFYVILILLSVTAMNQAGINTQILTNNISIILGSVLFAFALAFGLGAKDLLHNMLSGLYSRRSFDVGDRIRIDGNEGVIESIDNVHVVLGTDKGKLVIPAGEFVKKNVEILSKS
ncbi:MAG: hypothetical protein Kow0075_04010 [Salibacteraceae bacterium]